jgi:hypothetical protein
MIVIVIVPIRNKAIDQHACMKPGAGVGYSMLFYQNHRRRIAGIAFSLCMYVQASTVALYSLESKVEIEKACLHYRRYMHCITLRTIRI